MLTPLSVVPSRQSPATFSDDMDAFLAWLLEVYLPWANAIENSFQFTSTNGTSTTSLAITAGSKSLTTQINKAWAVGASVYLINAADITKLMVGQVTAYNNSTGALTVNVTTTLGSGTYADWTIGLALPQANSATFSGSVTATTLAVDANFYSTLVSGDPVTQFDSGDYMFYNRGPNLFGVVIGGTGRFFVTATDGPTRTTDATTSDGLVRKSQADTLIAAASERASAGEVQTGTNSTKLVTPATLQAGKMVSSAVVATTSGVSVDFTGIPSWARRITLLFNGVSTSGTANLLVQIGSGSFATSGYASCGDNGSAAFNSTAGFAIQTGAAAYTVSGSLTIYAHGGNVYISDHTMGRTDAALASRGGGNVTLAGVMDRLRLTTVGGTDTFDAGSVSIMWE